MTSPRRSNRGGHTKSNRKKDGVDNSADQTRCVCNQQHHEGVMIQCETCKVWQHCPCVGLGNGEVTPDKYFCESCRPQNHPYSVINGSLISNSKKVPHQSSPTAPTTRVLPAPSMSYSSKTNPPKKRNTMNSKEASIPMDLMLAQQKWNGEHMDEILDDGIISRLSTKKRKKDESATDAEDDGYSSDQGKENNPVTLPKADAKSELDLDMNVKMEQSLPSGSPKAGDKNMLKTKPRSSSPITNTVLVEARANPLKDVERLTGRVGTDNSRQESNVASKKRRMGMTISTGDEGLPVKPEPHAGQAISSSKSSVNNSAQNNITVKDPREESFEKLSSSGVRHGSRVASPTSTGRKSLLRRGVERNAQRQSSRHSTPVPNNSMNDDAQSMEPAGPTAVRYPSAKMTIHEMSKRAMQLLDYISRIQIDMADRKSKSCSVSTDQHATAGASSTLPQVTLTATKATEIIAPTNPTERIPEAQRAFTLPSTASTTSTVQFRLQEDQAYHDHQDDGRVPDLSPTSMDTTGPVLESTLLHENHPDRSHVHASRPTSIKVPVTALDISPLLSTPPLSVHDQSKGHYRMEKEYRLTVSTIRIPGSRDHEPLTPPHQPAGPFITGISSSDAREAGNARSKNSLEIMDKLTGDLIRFQEKYGSEL